MIYGVLVDYKVTVSGIGGGGGGGWGEKGRGNEEQF